MSKKNVSYLLSVCAVVSGFIPLSAGAISVSTGTTGSTAGSVSSAQRAGANSTLEKALNTSFDKKDVAVDSSANTDVDANLGRYHRDFYPKVNVGGETKVENSVRLNSSSNDDKSDEGDNRDADKKDKNEGDKNDDKEDMSNKDNRGRWVSWFSRFFGRVNGDIKISITDEREHATSTIINWKTNEETKGKVYFSSNASLSSTGTTTGLSVVENVDFSLQHTSTLSNLSVNTKYYYFIEYQGRDGKVLRSKVYDFKTKAIVNVDVTAPRILFSTALNVNSTSAHIIWVTNESSNSKIWFSKSAGVSTTSTTTASVKSSNSMSVFHSLTLSELEKNTKYFYVVGSTDASGNIVYSTEASFTTSSE